MCNNGFPFYFSSRHQSYTRRSEMKTIIAAVISIAFLMDAQVFQMEKQHSAFAISPYQSGFQHGVSDGKDSCSHPDDAVLEPGKGFAFHSWDFVRGYVTGFCTASPGTSSDADQASWDCDRSPFAKTNNEHVLHRNMIRLVLVGLSTAIALQNRQCAYRSHGTITDKLLYYNALCNLYVGQVNFAG